jgi:hypothetical protein
MSAPACRSRVQRQRERRAHRRAAIPAKRGNRFNGGYADQVSLTLSSPTGIEFSAFSTQQGALQISAGEFLSRNNLIGQRMTFANPETGLLVDQMNKSLQPFDVQLYSGGAPFFLNVIGNRVITNAQVINRNPMFEVITPTASNRSALEQGYDALSLTIQKAEAQPPRQPVSNLITYTGTPVALEGDPARLAFRRRSAQTRWIRAAKNRNVAAWSARRRSNSRILPLGNRSPMRFVALTGALLAAQAIAQVSPPPVLDPGVQMREEERRREELERLKRKPVTDPIKKLEPEKPPSRRPRT